MVPAGTKKNELVEIQVDVCPSTGKSKTKKQLHRSLLLEQFTEKQKMKNEESSSYSSSYLLLLPVVLFIAVTIAAFTSTYVVGEDIDHDGATTENGLWRRLDNSSNPPDEKMKSIGYIILDWVLIVFLLLLSGLFSGLTLGLMGLDKIGLEIVIGGDPDSDDAKYAKKIQPIRSHGNLLLCTLLLGNTCVNASLSILLASYTTGAVGVVLATMLILIFGEILPQAGCSRHALYVGAHAIWIIRFFLVVMYPIAKPISLGLDCMFNEEIGAIYSSSQLTKLVDIHFAHKQIGQEQAKMMTGAIDYADKTVQDVMTPTDKIFMLNVESTLDFALISQIFQSGHSRIPIYSGDRGNVVGVLLTKDLIVIDPEESTTVKAVIHFFGRPVHWLFNDCPLSEALALFKSGRSHLAMVRMVNNEVEDCDPFYETVGLITLEDIIEEIIQDEIVDETDQYIHVEDNQTKVNRAAFDFARLRLLDSHRETELSDGEVNVIVAHLTCNHSEFREISTYNLEKLVRKTPVSQFSNSGVEIYEKDKPIDKFTLILSGKVKIRAGKEGFVSEVGPWSVLGTQALSQEEGTHISDFTATITSESLRCIQFSKRDFDDASKKEINSTSPPQENAPSSAHISARNSEPNGFAAL
eukprot:CAMPEP_0204861724 /NCGR_PEP_ID=MMETSP1348-20121228/1858_1 /ASSEMBLY_ACC=CAM_ASM_000700 /TAXON_ID=215587 /ORGANISM="Aplanochytrium stocchinoi, Strain GSBS06" /LENGTH=637 /DNA_ID=CAMNT_0052011285 /DNA_START=145 /DNA_END=2058 /DNA_ORIENTATION=-